MSNGRPVPRHPQRTAQQQINYDVALRKLQEDMESFVEIAKRNGFKVHSLAWNCRPIYHANGHRRKWSVTLLGVYGQSSRENLLPPVVYNRPPRPSRFRKQSKGNQTPKASLK